MRTPAVGLVSALLTTLVLLPAAARAEPNACRAAITKLAAAYDGARLAALARCEEAIVRGKLPPGTVCTTDPKTAAALAKAAGKLASGVGKACGG